MTNFFEYLFISRCFDGRGHLSQVNKTEKSTNQIKTKNKILIFFFHISVLFFFHFKILNDRILINLNHQ